MSAFQRETVKGGRDDVAKAIYFLDWTNKGEQGDPFTDIRARQGKVKCALFLTKRVSKFVTGGSGYS